MFKLTKSLLETVYHSSRILLSTIRVTIAEEIELSRQRAKARYNIQREEEMSDAMRRECAMLPTLAESLLILGVPDIKDKRLVQQRYTQLFHANERTRGGSFYIQSKIVRAMERLDKEYEALAAVEEEAAGRKTLDANTALGKDISKEAGEKDSRRNVRMSQRKKLHTTRGRYVKDAHGRTRKDV